jgi:hypothetical protein
MPSFAGVDVSYGPALAFMRAANDFALGTVFQFAWLFGFQLFFKGVLKTTLRSPTATLFWGCRGRFLLRRR